jgi:hypothetical protein
VPSSSEDAPTLVQLRARLEELGCQLRDLSGEIVTGDGTYRVVYVVNPSNGQYVTLPLLADDDLIGQYTIANIERRLGLRTGFPSA